MTSKKVWEHCGDCCSWGPSELYDDAEKLLKDALKSGENFDTGWAGCKKEIVSFRVRKEGDEITCRASCSDDFDTEGLGEVVIHPEGELDHVYECILEGLSDAWDAANEDRKSNEEYAGFSINPVEEDGKLGMWVETLILPLSEWADMDGYPPGGNYGKWMWQDQLDPPLPDEVKEKLEDWAWSHHYGKVKERFADFDLPEPIESTQWPAVVAGDKWCRGGDDDWHTGPYPTKKAYKVRISAWEDE